jgi:hypothetical protein
MSEYQTVLIDSKSDLLNGTSGLRNHFIDSVRLDNARWKTIYTDTEVSRYGDLYLVIDQIAFEADAARSNFSLHDFLPKNISTDSFIRLEKPTGEEWANLSKWMPTEAPLNRMAKTLRFAEGWTTDGGRNSRVQISLYFMIVVLCFKPSQVGDHDRCTHHGYVRVCRNIG